MYPSHLGPGDRVDFVEPPAEGPILGYSRRGIAAVLQQDEQRERPISGRVNLYAYVLNNPVNLTDPSGLQPPPGSGGFWDSIGNQCYSMCLTYKGIYQQCTGDAGYIATYDRAYQCGPLGQTKDSSGCYY